MTEIWSAVSGTATRGTITLVHGALDRSAGMLRLSRRLDDEYRVQRYDRRGYGRSVPHEGPFTMPAQVDDLVEVTGARRSGPGRHVLIGHSYGGNVALAAVDRHPGRFDAVVTYESPMSWTGWWPHRPGSEADDWGHDPPAAAEGFMRSLIGDARWERLPPSTRAARRSEGEAMVGEMIDLRAVAPWSADRIDVPVLALYGEDGRSQHRRAAETIASSVADGRAVGVPGAAHFGPNTNPDAVAEIVGEFLSRLHG